jgi:RNA polymerase sigma factor (sigma-70 family)
VEDYAHFELLVPLVLPIARSVASRLPRSFDVEDLAQIGRLALWRACQRYDAERAATFPQFVRKIVRGAMLDAVRGAPYREATHEVLQSAVHGGEIAVTKSVAICDPFIARAVDELPARQRAVLDLRFCDGLSQFETEEALGVSRRTVRSEEAGAIAELRRELRRAA